METEIINALTSLLELILEYFGPIGTVLLAFAIIFLSFGWKYYNDYQKNKYTDLLLDEKDKTIQRMANQLRELRILQLKNSEGWSDEQIEKFFIKNEFSNVTEARDQLEQKKK